MGATWPVPAGALPCPACDVDALLQACLHTAAGGLPGHVCEMYKAAKSWLLQQHQDCCLPCMPQGLISPCMLPQALLWLTINTSVCNGADPAPWSRSGMSHTTAPLAALLEACRLHVITTTQTH